VYEKYLGWRCYGDSKKDFKGGMTMRIKVIKNIILSLCIVLGISCAVYGAMAEWGYLEYDTSASRTNIMTASLGKVGELRWENEKTTLYLDTSLLGGGTGDVNGPASSIADRIVIFDGITGKIIKDSGVAIVTTLANPGSHTNAPSEKAARDALNAKANLAGGNTFTGNQDFGSGFISLGAPIVSLPQIKTTTAISSMMDPHGCVAGTNNEYVVWPVSATYTGTKGVASLVLFHSPTRSVTTVTLSTTGSPVYQSIWHNGYVWTLGCYQTPKVMYKTDIYAGTTTEYVLSGGGYGKMCAIGTMIYGTASATARTWMWSFNTATGEFLEGGTQIGTYINGYDVTTDGTNLYMVATTGGTAGTGGIYVFSGAMSLTSPTSSYDLSGHSPVGCTYDADHRIVWAGSAGIANQIIAYATTTENTFGWNRTVGSHKVYTLTSSLSAQIALNYANGYVWLSNEYDNVIGSEVTVVDVINTLLVADGQPAIHKVISIPMTEYYDFNSVVWDGRCAYSAGFDNLGRTAFVVKEFQMLGDSTPISPNIVTTLANPGSHTNVATEKAVSDAITSEAQSRTTADNTKGNLQGGNTWTGTQTVNGNIDMTSYAAAVEIANAGTTGTTVNKLAKLTGNPSTAVIAGISDTTGVVGVVVAGAGTTGNAVIARNGICSCVFDGATTAGDYVQVSTSVAGDCKDAGATPPTNGQIIGRVLSTNGGAGTYAVSIAPPHYGSPWATTATPMITSAPTPTVTKSTSTTLTVAEVVSGSIYVTTAANTNILSLPQTASTQTSSQMGDGTVTCFYCTTAKGLNINPDDADTIYLDGVAQSSGQSIINTTTAIGDFICLQAIAGNKIYTWGSKGVWANGY
jgi:hypothetical protein